MKVFVMVVVCMVVVLQMPKEGSADCCYKINGYQCADCTAGTPFCGKGPCNIFGCNCGGGCRNGSCQNNKRRRSLEARDVISKADVDGDGKMSMEEAHALLADKEISADRVKRELWEMDADNDNFLSADEIDQKFF